MIIDLFQVFDGIPVIIQWAAVLIAAFLPILLFGEAISLAADLIGRKMRKRGF